MLSAEVITALGVNLSTWCQSSFISYPSVVICFVAVAALLIACCFDAEKLDKVGTASSIVLSMTGISICLITAIDVFRLEKWNTKLSFWPHSFRAVVDSIGIAIFVFYMHFFKLPPLQTRMVRPRAFPCLMSFSFVCAIFWNIAFGLVGVMLLGESTAPSIASGLIKHKSAVVPQYVTVSLWVIVALANLVLLPAVLAPFALQIPKLPHWQGLIRVGLVFVAALAARFLNLAMVANYTGGSVQCILAFILPPALALFSLSFQKTLKNSVRWTTMLIGIVSMGVTMYQQWLTDTFVLVADCIWNAVVSAENWLDNLF